MDEFSSNNQLGHKVSKFGKNKKILFYTIGLVAFFSFSYFLFLSAPGDFPAGTIVRIEKGSSLRSISLLLERGHIIRSRAVFESLVIIFGGDKRVQSADYSFENKLPVWIVAKRIAAGEYRMAPVSVTIPEGFNTKEIADAFALKLNSFNKNKFLLKAREGYLFPDTYFFLTTANEVDVLNSMTENFNKKINLIRPAIISSDKQEKEIITMASLIEGEAKGDADRAVISGILWRRISIGMPLQVDSAPETYKTKGLPESPIGNPGLLAIDAAIHPQKTDYLYYLHDKNGIVHYAKTLAEHNQNIRKYLK